MRYLLPILLLGSYAANAQAALIPYYRMDSLAFQSTDVILCDEVKYEESEATFTAVEVFKGSCKPKEKLTVKLDSLYRRTLISQPPLEKAEELPLGRALLFLNKVKVNGPEGRDFWEPVDGGVKLVIKGETYCYGQFGSNPGPLWLARMASENIKVQAASPYNEELLLKDLRVALEKAKGLKEPSRVRDFRDAIRPD
ncbi:MAG: hypothetical protein K8U57_11150 [Planctomycetes bacterium]|nr:hypothetical protein [Planctomycetota bacterium]